jgi:hypothetical protein
MEWQPIETVPQDGTPVLIYAEGDFGIGTCRIVNAGDLTFPSGSSAWIGKRPGERIGVWIGGRDMLEATHWMKLPESPSDPSPIL